MKGRKRNRIQEFDYSQSGYYFVTLCTNNNKSFFGKIINGKMRLNQFGKIITNTWIKIQTFHNNIELDEFVIMPNHIHGIIIINIEQRCCYQKLYNNSKGHVQLK